MKQISCAGYGFHADRVNVALVNGGLQPVARMTPNVPQRWQIWNADWKVGVLPALLVHFYQAEPQHDGRPSMHASQCCWVAPACMSVLTRWALTEGL